MIAVGVKLLATATAVLMNVSSTLYPMTAIVTKVDAKQNKFWIHSTNGHEWWFHGVEDWQKNDGVSLIMSDNGTPDIIDDDYPVEMRYCDLGNLGL